MGVCKIIGSLAIASTMICFMPIVAVSGERPLLRVVDLDIDESADVVLADGSTVTVKLLALKEYRDSICQAVRRAEVWIEVNGQHVELVSATYHLPTIIAGAQIDCPITQGYYGNSLLDDWGLEKTARLRLWPANSPLLKPGTFQYPAKQRWFATATQMANVPTFVDGGDDPSRKEVYYHSGLDIGGAEGMVEVVAATDGLVVSVRDDVLPGHTEDSPLEPDAGEVYLLDSRGWYYRYGHLQEINPQILPGRYIRMGTPIGILGKSGTAGGWSHLHFEIKSRQPSGKWGTQEGYAFLWEAYQQKYQPKIIAVARPHHFLLTGESALLDATKSWSAAGPITNFSWCLHDGTTATGSLVSRSYDQAGSYSEVLQVTDVDGNIDYDFAVVQVIDRNYPERTPPTVHAVYTPTFGIRPNDTVTFKVRSFRTSKRGEIWNFGDGSPEVRVQSDGNAVPHATGGYAVTTHRYEKPGQYIVSVRHTNQFQLSAVMHLHVTVER